MVFLSFSCSKEEPKPISTSTTKSCHLASRVEGNRREYESFRYELWKDLKSNEWTFDFIGTKRIWHPINLELGSFDNDHEGRGGWTSGQILEELEGWLMETGAPDIVLFSSHKATMPYKIYLTMRPFKTSMALLISFNHQTPM